MRLHERAFRPLPGEERGTTIITAEGNQGHVTIRTVNDLGRLRIFIGPELGPSAICATLGEAEEIHEALGVEIAQARIAEAKLEAM